MIETRPWGHFEILYSDEHNWLKRLTIFPGQSLSLQIHRHRDEYWVTYDDNVRVTTGWDETLNDYILFPNQVVFVPAGQIHRIRNTGQTVVRVIEWATGQPDEADIVRLDDDYGRAE